MPFIYSDTPHMRKHGPSGYEAYQSYKDWLRDEFTFRCVYCLERERWYPNGHAGFGVDHVKPKSQAQYAHLVCRYLNLVYACNRCNSAKQESVLIDPCEVAFGAHLRIDDDGEITGLTVEGWRIINILGLDLRAATNSRKAKLRILSLYRRYPNDEEIRALYLDTFGFPDDLPDLTIHSRTANAKPDGVLQSYHRQREAGTLPPNVWSVVAPDEHLASNGVAPPEREAAGALNSKNRKWAHLFLQFTIPSSGRRGPGRAASGIHPRDLVSSQINHT